MLGPESTSKTPVLPRMVQMETGVVRTGVVSYPLVSGVDMRRFGIFRLIGEMTFGWRTTSPHTALRGAFLFRPALRSAVLLRTGCGRRIAAEARGTPEWAEGPGGNRPQALRPAPARLGAPARHLHRQLTETPPNNNLVVSRSVYDNKASNVM
jgi:hypothetical protein